MPGTSDGVLLGPGALAKAITKPYDNVTLWQTGNFCTHDGKVYKFVGEDLVAGESWDPTHWSETKVTDELGILQAQIDALDPESGTGVFTDVAFTINTNQWTESSGTYSHNISNALIKATSGISVYWDSNYRNFNADVNVVKSTGYATITTTALPSNAVSGTLRIIDSVSGVLPTYRGGTGAVTAKGARQNLNVSIRDIPIDFGTVSSLPQTAYDADITADMIPSHWEYTNPAACPNGLKCTTAAGSVTISLPTGGTLSGSTGVKIYLMNPRSAADGAGGQEQEQNAADYVQLSAQSLTAAQQTQVRTNINAAGMDTLAGYIENGNTASRSYTKGQYFIWKGVLHEVMANISSGSGISIYTNVWPVTEGLGNSISGKIPPVVNDLTSDSTTSALSAAQGKALNSNLTKNTVTITSTGGAVTRAVAGKFNNLVVGSFAITLSNSTATGGTKVAIVSEHPLDNIVITAVDYTNDKPVSAVLQTSGDIFVYGATSKVFYFSFAFFTA